MFKQAFTVCAGSSPRWIADHPPPHKLELEGKPVFSEQWQNGRKVLKEINLLTKVFFRDLCSELGNLTKYDLETAVSKPKSPRDRISLVLIGMFVAVFVKMLLGDISSLFRLTRQTKANIIGDDDL